MDKQNKKESVSMLEHERRIAELETRVDVLVKYVKVLAERAPKTQTFPRQIPDDQPFSGQPVCSIPGQKIELVTILHKYPLPDDDIL